MLYFLRKMYKQSQNWSGVQYPLKHRFGLVWWCASGSYDLEVHVVGLCDKCDWAKQQPVLASKCSHRSNVFCHFVILIRQGRKGCELGFGLDEIVQVVTMILNWL